MHERLIEDLPSSSVLVHGLLHPFHPESSHSYLALVLKVRLVQEYVGVRVFGKLVQRGLHRLVSNINAVFREGELLLEPSGNLGFRFPSILNPIPYFYPFYHLGSISSLLLMHPDLVLRELIKVRLVPLSVHLSLLHLVLNIFDLP